MTTVNSLSANLNTNEVTSEIHYGDWDDTSYLPGDYFQKDTNCYNRDKELYSHLQMQAFNTFGVPLNYFVVDYNTNYNTIFNEDNDRTIIRNFECMSYYELPHEDYEASLFGLYELDKFSVHINKEHFAWASTYSNGVSAQYNSIEPKAGDLFRTTYNNHFYEIMLVKQQAEQFLQKQHSYELICRIAKNQHYSLSATLVSSAAVNNELLKADILQINSDIDTIKTDVLYVNNSESSTTVNNPFGDW